MFPALLVESLMLLGAKCFHGQGTIQLKMYIVFCDYCCWAVSMGVNKNYEGNSLTQKLIKAWVNKGWADFKHGRSGLQRHSITKFHT